MSRLSLVTAALLVATAVSAAAQTRPPVSTEPLAIAPPGGSAQEQWERTERAREQLNYQRERDRLDLEQRALRNRQIEERGDRLLGAPVFVQPGVAAPYAAPQYPYPSGAPGYGAPGYGAPTQPGAARGCQRYAPAYDEAGRFLANVCIR